MLITTDELEHPECVGDLEWIRHQVHALKPEEAGLVYYKINDGKGGCVIESLLWTKDMDWNDFISRVPSDARDLFPKKQVDTIFAKSPKQKSR